MKKPFDKTAKDISRLLDSDCRVNLCSILAMAAENDFVKYLKSQEPFVEILEKRGCLTKGELYDCNSEEKTIIYSITPVGRNIREMGF